MSPNSPTQRSLEHPVLSGGLPVALSHHISKRPFMASALQVAWTSIWRLYYHPSSIQIVYPDHTTN